MFFCPMFCFIYVIVYAIADELVFFKRKNKFMVFYFHICIIKNCKCSFILFVLLFIASSRQADIGCWESILSVKLVLAVTCISLQTIQCTRAHADGQDICIDCARNGGLMITQWGLPYIEVHYPSKNNILSDGVRVSVDDSFVWGHVSTLALMSPFMIGRSSF